MKIKIILTPAALLFSLVSISIVNSQVNEMSFFVTSVGSGEGGNLGGLVGADAHCSALATAAGSQGKTWRAYLSTTATTNIAAVDARNRIGFGPWYNAEGVVVANNLNHLHSESLDLSRENFLTEFGDVAYGLGDPPNQRHVLTGTGPDGYSRPINGDTTCNNWTSNENGSAIIGHFGRVSGGNPIDTTRTSSGCSQQDLVSIGSNGYFYCFAIN